MKKVFTILMTVIMCVSLVACASNKPVEEVKEPETVTEQVTEAVEETEKTVEEEPVKTLVTFFNPDEVGEHIKSYSWAPYNPAALGNGNYIEETDTQTNYISGNEWMTGDKHSVNTAWNRFVYSTTKWTRNFELGFGSTGHRITICMDIAEKDKVTAIVYDGDIMYKYVFSKGYLVKAPENGPAWLDDEAAVSEFISMSNEYLAAVDYTIDDVFDINAFLTAIHE